MKKLFLGLSIFFLFLINANAASLCSYKDQITLNQKAANIKRGYDIITEIYEDEDGEVDVDTFRISIYNLTEEFYAVITNTKNRDEKRINYSDVVDGVASFDWDDVGDLTTFDIKIYTSSKSPCPDELYKTLLLTTPRYNPYSETNACYSAPEFSLCQRYVTFSQMSQDEFLDRVEGYIEGTVDEDDQNIPKDDQNFFTKLIKFISKYKWVFIIGTVVVIGVSGGYVVIKKNRKQRKLEI